MLPTSFLDTSNSDITTGVVSTWDAKNSNSYTSAELSTDPYSSDGYASSATAALSITESIPTTDTINTEYHSNGDITTSGGFKEISLTSHYEGGFTSESAGYTIASPSGSTQEFATATITSCFESKCSETVVTYISSVSHSTVTTGYEDTRFTGSIFSGDLASTGDNIVSALGRSVTEATNPFATNNDIATTSTVGLIQMATLILLLLDQIHQMILHRPLKLGCRLLQLFLLKMDQQIFPINISSFWVQLLAF